MVMWKRLPIPLFVAAFGLLVLPPILLALGLTMTSATEVVVFALACMALNILVGHTGLVSFGHGAWFGLSAYAAALFQRNLMPDSFFGPTIAGVLLVGVVATAFGFLILRRRGVYFSLLTLALAAMLYAVSFRWTEVTGGENGLGGIGRHERGDGRDGGVIAAGEIVRVVGNGRRQAEAERADEVVIGVGRKPVVQLVWCRAGVHRGHTVSYYVNLR
jgi:hypothetical protein